jgi:hypothetical protein
MEYTVVRHRGLLGSDDDIAIKETGFHCIVPSPSGKYKFIELPCKQCCNVTLHFAIETMNKTAMFNYGIKFLSFYCLTCGYRSETKDMSWSGLEKMDLYKTCLDYIKGLDNETRQKWVSNLKSKYKL